MVTLSIFFSQKGGGGGRLLLFHLIETNEFSKEIVETSDICGEI